MTRKKRPTRYVRNYAPGAAKEKDMLTDAERKAMFPTFVPVFQTPDGHEWDFRAGQISGQVKCRWCGASFKLRDKKACLPERTRKRDR